jgi:hypothetical protein
MTLSPEELDRMEQKGLRDLEKAQAEVARIRLEVTLIREARARGERGKPGRRGALSIDLVLEAASETEAPMTAGDVRQTLVARGLTTVTVNAVRNHLNRLVESGELKKTDNTYSLATPEFVPNQFIPAAEDDIPF